MQVDESPVKAFAFVTVGGVAALNLIRDRDMQSLNDSFAIVIKLAGRSIVLNKIFDLKQDELSFSNPSCSHTFSTWHR